MFNLYRRNQGYAVLLGVVCAFILGIATPSLFKHLEFISETFINLLKLCALPIIFTSLVVTIGTLPQANQLKIIAKNSVFYIVLSEIIAVTIGLVVFNFIDVSSGINASTLLSGVHEAVDTNSTIDINQIFNYIFTSNLFASLVKYDILPIVMCSIMLGITCALNQKAAKPMLDVLISARHVFMSLLSGIMLLAPIAIFVLIGDSVANSYQSGVLAANLIGLLKFVGLFFFALFLHFLWQLLLVLYLYRHLSLKVLLTEALPIFITAFISSSSLATLPVAMEKAEKLGGNKRVVEFMLPVCASMNFASGMMYEIAATLFFLHVMNIHPDITHQILLAILCIVTGIAVGGIPETSMVSFVTVFNMAGIPLSAISILMPLDRIVDRVRTMVNIFGNTCGTLVVSKSKVD